MNNKKSLAKLILLVLEKAVDGTVRLNDFINNPGYYAYYDGWNYSLNKPALSQALKRLREKGLVDFISDENLAVRITDQGRNQALWTRMRSENEKWDGKWRIVIWDIPEKRRKARDLLRYQLKQLGFKKVQNSVWASKKDCAKLLNKYIERIGIADWVSVFESNTLKF